MITLFNSAAPVKTPRTFGNGLTPARPFEPSPSDRSWWAAESARLEAARLDRHYDELAAVSAYLDRHEAGIAG